MFLIEILLPLYDNSGTPIPRNDFERTRGELLERFGGLTAHMQAPAEGLWKDDANQAKRDDIVVLEVMVPEIERAWWSDYRRTIEQRFRQESIVIRSQQVEIL